ncbi:hypothetical protein M404DRAFT_915861 [Pisolithus tinctorius Marx 270]|uniref:Uncharacterized protein n=1 Tax=Pisolithus tinctorius Marx 270 TaxID=870435 RepID=A0A0C3JHT1_PISTI|nr:hypothetical protein M404DRAFT_915861 [Pisolithus tinctorius Marx 270]
MDDAWQAQDMAPSGISIPTNGSGAPAEEPVWNGGGRSPGTIEEVAARGAITLATTFMSLV